MGHFFTEKALAGEMQLRDIGLALFLGATQEARMIKKRWEAQRLAIRPWITLGHFPAPA